MTAIAGTEEFNAWLAGLDDREKRSVDRVVAMLAAHGIALGEPHSSAVRGSRFPLRELRPKRGSSALRVIHAFDPRREALLLLGGNKATDARFYRRAIQRAEALWLDHVEGLRREDLS
jgi:hypothetical protein